MSPVKANTPAKGGKTPSKGKTPAFTPPKTRRRSMKPPTPKAATPVQTKQTPQKPKTPVTKDVPQKTPQKAVQNKTPAKAKTPKAVPSPQKTSSAVLQRPVKTPAQKALDDKKTLFLKGLPKTCTDAELRAVSSDIVEVRMRHAKWQKKGSNLFAFVEFKTEAAAEKHFSTLEKFGGRKVFVDFVGSKAKADTKRKRPVAPTVDAPTRLYATGLAFNGGDVEKIKELTKCTKVDVPKLKHSSQNRGYAFLHFQNETDAAKALKGCRNAVVNGNKMELRPAQLHVFDKEKSGEPAAKKAKTQNGQKAAKKAPTKEEEESDEEDEEGVSDDMDGEDDFDEDDDDDDDE